MAITVVARVSALRVRGRFIRWLFRVLRLFDYSVTAGNHLAIDPGSLLHALRTGKRLPKPCECDDRVYAVMQSCWNGEASQRPDFAKVVLLMESIAQ